MAALQCEFTDRQKLLDTEQKNLTYVVIFMYIKTTTKIKKGPGFKSSSDILKHDASVNTKQLNPCGFWFAFEAK